MDSGLLKHLGRHSGFAPGRVVDALAPPVVRRDDDERLLELGKVVLGLGTGSFYPPLEVTTLLNQMDALQRVGGGKLGLELFEPHLQGIRACRTSAARTGPLESDKVPAHCISLATTFGERVFVGRGETWLGWLLSWWHTTSIAYNDTIHPMLLCRASRASLIGHTP